jgi:hypothetical protein
MQCLRTLYACISLSLLSLLLCHVLLLLLLAQPQNYN